MQFVGKDVGSSSPKQSTEHCALLFEMHRPKLATNRKQFTSSLPWIEMGKATSKAVARKESVDFMLEVNI